VRRLVNAWSSDDSRSGQVTHTVCLHPMYVVSSVPPGSPPPSSWNSPSVVLTSKLGLKLSMKTPPPVVTSTRARTTPGKTRERSRAFLCLGTDPECADERFNW